MIDIPCVILSGGASRRMGEDKSLMPFKGFKTLIEYQYNKLTQIFPAVYISSKKDKFNFQANLLLDESQEVYSPMIALHSILTKIDHEKVFITTVDVPFIYNETFDMLLKASKDHKITIAKDLEYEHNLCGVYSKSLLPIIEELLSKDIHKMTKLINNSGSSSKILFEDNTQFANINTKDEYNKYKDN